VKRLQFPVASYQFKVADRATLSSAPFELETENWELTTGIESALDIEIPHVQRMFFDELAPWLDLVAH
jgi:hypothetical protein